MNGRDRGPLPFWLRPGQPAWMRIQGTVRSPRGITISTCDCMKAAPGYWGGRNQASSCL